MIFADCTIIHHHLGRRCFFHNFQASANDQLVVWVGPYERDCCAKGYPDSNPKPPNAPNQQSTITVAESIMAKQHSKLQKIHCFRILNWVVATQTFFMFIPIWGLIQFDDHIFFIGLVQPPTSEPSDSTAAVTKIFVSPRQNLLQNFPGDGGWYDRKWGWDKMIRK